MLRPDGRPQRLIRRLLQPNRAASVPPRVEMEGNGPSSQAAGPGAGGFPLVSEEPEKPGGGATLSTAMELSGPRSLIDDLRARLSDARRFL